MWWTRTTACWGWVTAAAAKQAAGRGEKNLNEALKTVPVVVPETALEEVLPRMLDRAAGRWQ